MSEFVLEHRPSPNFYSGLASGITVTGPTGDGVLQLMFHRDGARIKKTTFSSKEVNTPSGEKGIEVDPQSGKMETELFREELASIGIPLNVAVQFLEILKNHLQLTNAIPK